MSDFRVEFLFKPFKVTEVRYRGPECPRPRSGHRIACDDINLYCFGGYNPSLPFDVAVENPTWTPIRPLFKELWKFSIANRKWLQYKFIENMPEELASNTMCMNGRNLMIHGGTGAPFGNKFNTDVVVWRTHIDDSRLQYLDVTGSRPPALYGQSSFCYEGGFYTIGGTNGYTYNCDIFRLDLRTMVWAPDYLGTGQEGEPRGRYRHELARVGENIYIIGGGTGQQAYQLNEVPMYNLKTKTWRLLAAKPDDSTGDMLLPLPRKHHSAVQISTPAGEQVFVAGGTDGEIVYDDIWRLNLSDLQWTLMKKTVLPHDLYFHSAAVTSTGCMYVFGGVEPNGDIGRRNNILYKVWLCIPSLSEISWEAVLNFYPNLDKISRCKLLSIGIPLRFVDRIHAPY